MAGCHQKEGGFCICVTSDEIQGGLIPGPVPSIPGGISCNTVTKGLTCQQPGRTLLLRISSSCKRPPLQKPMYIQALCLGLPTLKILPILLSLCIREARVYCTSNQASVKHPRALPHDSFPAPRGTAARRELAAIGAKGWP